jgi:hypothetical protein
MNAAVNRANDELSQIVATPDASIEQRVQTVKLQRSGDLYQVQGRSRPREIRNCPHPNRLNMRAKPGRKTIAQLCLSIEL